MANANVLVWYYLSNNTLWAELTDDDGIGLDGATVTATIVDAELGTPVGDQTWPVTLDDLGDGLYNWTGTSALDLERDRFYVAQVKAVAAGTGAERYAETVIKVVVDRT